MIAQWVKSARKWWEQNWIRFHAVMTPIGSGLVALWLSQAENVGWFWNSQAEFEVAGRFSSVGILFYTGTFAILEVGVWLSMVLALKALEGYERRKEQRRQERLLSVLQEFRGEVSEEVMEQLIQVAARTVSEEDRGQFMERWRELQSS